MDSLPDDILTYLLDWCKLCELIRYKEVSRIFHTIIDRIMYRKFIIRMYRGLVDTMRINIRFISQSPKEIKYKVKDIMSFDCEIDQKELNFRLFAGNHYVLIVPLRNGLIVRDLFECYVNIKEVAGTAQAKGKVEVMIYDFTLKIKKCDLIAGYSQVTIQNSFNNKIILCDCVTEETQRLLLDKKCTGLNGTTVDSWTFSGRVRDIDEIVKQIDDEHEILKRFEGSNKRIRIDFTK